VETSVVYFFFLLLSLYNGNYKENNNINNAFFVDLRQHTYPPNGNQIYYY